MYVFSYLFIHSFSYLFIHLVIYSFIRLLIYLLICLFIYFFRDSAVGIATRYRLDGPGIQSR